ARSAPDASRSRLLQGIERCKADGIRPANPSTASTPSGSDNLTMNVSKSQGSAPVDRIRRSPARTINPTTLERNEGAGTLACGDANYPRPQALTGRTDQDTHDPRPF